VFQEHASRRLHCVPVAARPTFRCHAETRRRRQTSDRAANDNKPGVTPSLRYVWSVYRVAARARWIGQVVASTADEAIEAAAVKIRTDAWKLIAVRRWEVA
jgi:hypothetical protein